MYSRTILMTGVTGFVGSALAARFLESGAELVVLSRNDPHGTRTRTSIASAAEGMGLSPIITTDNVRVEPLSSGKSPQPCSPSVFEGVDEVWNVAADMTYATNTVCRSFDFNVAGLAALYEMATANNSTCQRFYHVSTAYTAAYDSSDVPETIHVKPKVKNTYQLTKWTGEVLLKSLSYDNDLPVTIFRPSIVLGHSQSGWCTGVPFGVYMFLEASLQCADNGFDGFRLDLNPDSGANLIPIDVLVDRAFALSTSSAPRTHFEIVTCAADSNTKLSTVAGVTVASYGVGISFGPPETAVDHAFNKAVAINAWFANQTWNFSTTNMQRLLGHSYVPYQMTKKDLWNLCQGYTTRRQSLALSGTKTTRVQSNPQIRDQTNAAA